MRTRIWLIGMLYLIEILHQTTTVYMNTTTLHCCILSKFYIKPQPAIANVSAAAVVSYRNSTSNHNNCLYNDIRAAVVSYRNSTSNHNSRYDVPESKAVVSYRNSTSNHNMGTQTGSTYTLYLIEILHQTTTSLTAFKAYSRLYLIEILHQTTTANSP